jgi:hypothetical protein
MNLGNKILFFLCAIAAAIGIGIYLEASAFQKTAKETMGYVSSTSISRFEIKYYSDDGNERIYAGNHGGKGRRFHDGEEIMVYYQIDNPDKARISNGAKGGKKVIFWAFILLLFNLLSIYFGKKKETSEKKFKTTGRKVEAEILKIEKDFSLTVLKENPWCIDCKWTDPMTGREYTHTIRYVWQDPKTLLAGRNRIDVYIDRDDPEKYYMDIAFLGDVAR